MSEGFWSNSERSEAQSASLRKVCNLVARVVLAACELGWPIYIYFFVHIYRSFPVGIRIQCDVSQYMHFRFVLHSSSRPDFYLSSVKEIFRLSVNHEQIPSIPMTHKSKHYNSRFKKWMQILAGENSSGASTERRIEI